MLPLRHENLIVQLGQHLECGRASRLKLIDGDYPSLLLRFCYVNLAVGLLIQKVALWLIDFVSYQTSHASNAEIVLVFALFLK